MEEEYRKYREELDALHKEYRFNRIDKEGPIPRNISAKRRRLSGKVYELARKRWWALPEHIKMPLRTEVYAAKRSDRYRKAMAGRYLSS
jgi:hypothetical protein